jgi:hypothetical protein
MAMVLPFNKEVRERGYTTRHESANEFSRGLGAIA